MGLGPIYFTVRLLWGVVGTPPPPLDFNSFKKAWGLELIACETYDKQVDRQRDRQTDRHTDRQLLIKSPKVLTMSIAKKF